MSETSISVMTFNTANDFITPHALVEMLQHTEADIIGLQEVSPRNAAALDKNLQDRFPYRILHGKHFDGKALLSRYPIFAHALFTVRLTRPHIEATLEINHQHINVYVVHLPAPNYRRMEAYSPHCQPELDLLLARQNPNLPTLFIGDFNSVERSTVYQTMIQARFTDTFRAVGTGRGRTFPARFQYMNMRLPQVLRIDYIWASDHFTPLTSYVGKGYGSDHLPVISKLNLTSAVKTTDKTNL